MHAQLSTKKSKLSSAQNQRVAEFLRNKREAEGLTLGQFARKYEIDASIYRTWEAGRTIPKVEQAWDFLKVLGPEGREKLNYHLARPIDMLRGEVGTEWADAFDELAIIRDDATTEVKKRVLRDLHDLAGKYGKR